MTKGDVAWLSTYSEDGYTAYIEKGIEVCVACEDFTVGCILWVCFAGCDACQSFR